MPATLTSHRRPVDIIRRLPVAAAVALARLELRPDGDEATDVRLVGSYEPPLGTLGRFADGLAGHKVVVASPEALLDDVVARLAEGRTDGWL